MALGYGGDAPGVNLMEQGVCHVVQGRSLSQRAAYARRVGAASMLLLAAVVACATVMGSGSVGEKQLAESRLYSATGWASLYGGSGSSQSSGDGWGDNSGDDDTGARNTGLHESDDDTSDIFGNSDSDPDSTKNDVHWNAAGGDSTTKTATSIYADQSSSSGTSQEEAKSSQGSGSKSTKQTKAKAKGGKPSTTDALLDLSKSFDKGLPKPKSRAEEKKQKAEQLANLLRIQKELTSDYKKVMAKGDSVKNVGKKMGLMKAKTAQHAELNGDPFSV